MDALPGTMDKILIRSTNWIGDAIMTTPAVRTIRQNFPAADITLLALPWVADVFRASPRVNRIMFYERDGRHRGLQGKIALASELRRKNFDAAILLQNAFEAAFLTFAAGIPVRAGYTTDGRGLLLTHRVKRKSAIRQVHQVHYYQEMLRGLGLAPGPDELELTVSTEALQWARDYLREIAGGVSKQVVGINPGAAYGPAKRWPADKFAGLVEKLLLLPETMVIVFGTEADRSAADRIRKIPGDGRNLFDLTGRTTLAQAMGLISLCSVFVTNDSGLMHVAAALHTPTVAIFGSTNPITTGPFSSRASIVRSELECSPCLETHCPRDHFQCMENITIDAVLRAVHEHLLPVTKAQS